MDVDAIKDLLAAGDIASARACLLELVSNQPASEAGWLLLSGVSARTDDAELGAKAFRALAGLRPSDALASSGLVWALMRLQNYAGAKVEIERFSRFVDLTIPSHCSVAQEHREAMEMIQRSSGVWNQ
ncbi:hypothetical protein [Stenotrophomonas sp.]|uniref:tetratricopeptide repeat protein n=1 Tax=Stenotrophomonas sp. TaxID=69392 RepID=UPI002FCAD5E1